MSSFEEGLLEEEEANGPLLTIDRIYEDAGSAAQLPMGDDGYFHPYS